jgi:hypothetical protein
MRSNQIHDAMGCREVSVLNSPQGLSTSNPVTFEWVTRPVTMIPAASSLCCPDCQTALDLQQPDVDQPTQLLGICDGCSKWFFLVELEEQCNGTMLFELPSAATMRSLLSSLALH